MKSFSDRFICNLKPKAKKYVKSEGRGFIIRILPSGVKTFLYRYKINKVQKVIHLGNYEEGASALSLARNKFNLASKAVQEGNDPVKAIEDVYGIIPHEETTPTPAAAPDIPVASDAAPTVSIVEESAVLDLPKNLPRKVEDIEVLYGPPPETIFTIKELAFNYLVRWSNINHSRTWFKTNLSVLQNELLPAWWDKHPNDLRPKHVNYLLEKIASRAPGTARNLLKTARRMYGYAVTREYAEFNPFLGNFTIEIPALTSRSRERALHEKEIKTIWKRIDDGPGTLEVKKALKLILVTAQRPNEVAGMRWSEIDGNEWIIPPERIKTEKGKRLNHDPRPHLVYLSPLALELIGEPIPWAGDIVFPSFRGHNKKTGKYNVKPLDRHALSRRVAGEDYHKKGDTQILVKKRYYGLPRWSPNDLRRTADTMMNSIGITHRVVDKILNHSLGKIEGTYNLYEYYDEKKDAMLKWEAKLREIIKGE